MRKFDSSKLGKIIFIIVHVIAVFYLYIFVSHLIGYNDFEKWALSEVSKIRPGNYTYLSSTYYNALDDYGEKMFNSLIIGVGILIIYWGGRFLFNYVFPKTDNKKIEE